MQGKKKRVAGGLILTMLLLLVAGCGTKPSAPEKSPSTGQEAQPSAGSTPPVQEVVPKAGNDELSVDQLYEKAKAEGKVVIYAKGSKFNDVKVSFEAKYPGITVEPYKISSAELIEKLKREHDAGVYNVDVVHLDINPGLVKGGYVTPFWPKDIMANFYPEYQKLNYPVHYMTVTPLIYNTEVYKAPPINNWWDLTEPEWKGRVMINDPVANLTYSELMLTIIRNADEMAAAYKAKYGKEIELKEANAGYEFIARFIANDPVLMSSGEDIIDAVGFKGQTKPPIGFASSSKLRHIEQSGLPIAPIFDVAPRVSVMSSSVLYIANKAPHPNAAQLLARWSMGEVDGKAAGLEPFNTDGVWIPRPDVKNKNDRTVDTIKAWELDQEFYDANFAKFRNFWLSKIS